jgi:hypothetical protein
VRLVHATLVLPPRRYYMNSPSSPSHTGIINNLPDRTRLY